MLSTSIRRSSTPCTPSAGTGSADRDREQALLSVGDLLGIGDQIGHHARGPWRIDKRVGRPPAADLAGATRRTAMQHLNSDDLGLLAQRGKDPPPASNAAVLRPRVLKDKTAPTHLHDGPHSRRPRVDDVRGTVGG